MIIILSHDKSVSESSLFDPRIRSNGSTNERLVHARLDQDLPDLVLHGLGAHLLDLERLLDSTGHVDERIGRVAPVQVLVVAAQLRVRLLQQRRPELVRLLFVRAEQQPSVRLTWQTVVDANVHPLTIVPEVKVEYACVRLVERLRRRHYVCEYVRVEGY